MVQPLTATQPLILCVWACCVYVCVLCCVCVREQHGAAADRHLYVLYSCQRVRIHSPPHSPPHTALQILPGNHEVEQEGALPATQTQFLAYQMRFRMPSVEAKAVDGNLYYSFEIASAHVIMLNSYMDYSPSSNQYKWLLNDLASCVCLSSLLVFLLLFGQTSEMIFLYL